jgi:hypothetical protein
VQPMLELQHRLDSTVGLEDSVEQRQYQVQTRLIVSNR